MRPTVAAALTAGLLLLATAAHSEPIVQTVEEHRDDRGELDRRPDGFVHRATGYLFPISLGDMPVRKTITYGPGDASVYYTLHGGANGDPWLSLYVYPVSLEFDAEAAETEKALAERMPGTAIEPPPGAPPLPAGAVERWFDATADGIPLLTGYRLGRSGEWYVKVRLSVPRSGGQAALDRAWRGLAAVPWSVPAAARTAQPTRD